MSVSNAVRSAIAGSSFIRKMFEEGMRLKKEYGENEVSDFSIGNPDLDPPREFHEALLKLAAEDPPGCHAYMANAGYPEARAAMARRAGREHGVEIPADNVVMCTGAAAGLNVFFKTVLDPLDEVLSFSPYFVEYRAYVANHGGVMVALPPTQDFLPDPSALAAALGPKTKALIINNPNNPTGRLYPASSIAAVAKTLDDFRERTGKRVYLVVDEPYRDLVYGGKSTPPVMSAYADTVVVNSFSKSLSLPGERIGYIAVNPACHEATELMAGLIMCNRVLGFVNAPALMQRAVTALETVRMDMGAYERRRNAIAEGMRAAGFSMAEPDGAFYLWVRAPLPGGRLAEAGELGDDNAFCDFLKAGYRILAVPGTGFGGPGWFRLSYAVPDASIARAVPLFAQALKDWKARA